MGTEPASIDAPDKPIIPNSTVLREKRKTNDEVDVRRVRIVAGGHKQPYNVNYTETYSSTVKMPSSRTITLS